jgi:hypothetical protein
LFVRHGQGGDGLQKDLQRLLAGSAVWGDAIGWCSHWSQQ